MQVSVRVMTEKDAAFMARLEQACFDDAWNEQSVRSTLSRRDFCGFCAFMGDVAVGYICGSVLFEDAEILRVAVDGAYRKQGIGAMLLDAFVQSVTKQGAQRVLLEVRESNLPAIALYRSRGFVSGRVRTGYYANGEAAVEMEKKS